MGILGEPTMNEFEIDLDDEMMNNMAAHDFETDLAFAASKEGKMNKIYGKLFKNLDHVETITDKVRQHNGIDRLLVLRSGESVTIQEKWRRIEFKHDFLIEYCSVYKDKKCVKKGWIFSIDSNYIISVYPASQIALIYPVLQLKLAWDEYGTEWIKRFGTIAAKNSGYSTLNVPVPCDVLEEAMREVMHFNYGQQALFGSLVDFNGNIIEKGYKKSEIKDKPDSIFPKGTVTFDYDGELAGNVICKIQCPHCGSTGNYPKVTLKRYADMISDFKCHTCQKYFDGSPNWQLYEIVGTFDGVPTNPINIRKFEEE
jgi:hypothetical protein